MGCATWFIGFNTASTISEVPIAPVLNADKTSTTWDY